ncbi:MAG TPA: VWA domain-containing protein [candidate division Zixibacteria bacterium]|nr:VWA domain-containing protein [candidate division Zixibacteria bacterium]
MATNLLALTIQSSRETIASSDDGQLLYLLVDVNPPREDSIAHLPRNLSLIVDSSTSMKGDRLSSVKNAAAAIIEGISPDDKISVISFSDRAQVVLPASPVEQKKTLISQINSIRADGGTEIFQGLEAGFKEIRKSNLDSYTNHMILLTDGHTYGDTKQCLNLARDAAEQGVDITAFGIGNDWNDAFLDKLVVFSGSQSIYIEKPSQAMGYLQDKIKGLGVIFASTFRLVDDFPDGVELLSAFKVAPYAQLFVPDGLDIRLGAIEAETPLVLLLEFLVEVDKSEDVFHLPVNFLSDIPSKRARDYPLELVFEIPTSGEEAPMNPPEQLIEAVRALNLYRMNERIWRDIEGGDIPQATMRLQRLSTRLLEAGHSDLALQAQIETERLKAMEAWSESARKQFKFGTRSLITQTFRLKA